MPIMMLIVEILLIIINRYKMENLKTNWKLPEKTKNPRSPTGNWLQENWKHSENSRKKLKFSLKNCKIGRQGRENSPQSAQQKSPTALKRLDISIKRTLKIGHRLRWFCAMQQRKEPVTSFMSQALGADEGIWTHTLLRELEPESSASASSATSAYFVWPPHRRRILL